MKICELLLGKGANTGVKNNFENTPLHYACRVGSLEICKLLIDKTNKKAKNDEGPTPLYVACLLGFLLICDLLVKSGALVDVKSNCNRTPLESAASRGYLEICKVLLDNKADLNNQQVTSLII